MLISATTLLMWRLYGVRVMRVVRRWSARQRALAVSLLAALLVLLVWLLLPATPRAHRLLWPPDGQHAHDLRTWNGCVVISAVGERRPELYEFAVLSALAALNHSSVYLLVDSSNALAFRAHFLDAVRDSLTWTSSSSGSPTQTPRLRLLNGDTIRRYWLPSVDLRLGLPACVKSWFALREFVYQDWKLLVSDGEAGRCGGGQMLLLNTPLAVVQGNPFYAYAGERSAPSFWTNNWIPMYSKSISPNEYLLFTEADSALDSASRTTDQSAVALVSRCLQSASGEALLAQQPRLIGAGSVILGTLYSVRAFLSLQTQLLERVAVNATEEQIRTTNLVGRPDSNRGTGAAEEASDDGSNGCLRSCAIGHVLTAYAVLALGEDPDSQARHFVHKIAANDLKVIRRASILFNHLLSPVIELTSNNRNKCSRFQFMGNAAKSEMKPFFNQPPVVMFQSEIQLKEFAHLCKIKYSR